MGNTKEKTPKTYSLKVTDNALQNLNDITGYIAYIKHQPLNAISIGDKILITINRIEKNPFSFRECEEITTKNKIYRKAVCLSWLIIYKIKSSQIVILGIIHGSRRPSKIRSFRKIK